MTVTFAGKRLDTKGKWVYLYLDEDDKRLLFGSKLGKFDVLGDLLEIVESSKDSFKVIKDKVGRDTQENITKWSIEQGSDVQRKQSELASKIKPNGHVDALIEAVKKSNYANRRQIALYIYNKLI